MSYKITFLLPSMSRPEKFFSTVNNIQEMCLKENYEVISIHEQSDFSMNNPSVKERISQYPFLKPHFISSTGKIDAINKGLQYLPSDYDILVLCADDIRFTQKGFDYIIEVDMQQNFPDLSGILHYPDGKYPVKDRQITMPVMGRKLVERFGYIYHPSYVSLWADNEMLAVVKQIKKHIYFNKSLFIHEHFEWGLADFDGLYRKNQSFYQTDSDNYFRRVAINFDL